MAADTIMEGIIETATIITGETDIVMDITTTMDTVIIMDDDTRLEMLIMDTTTVESIIVNLRFTGVEDITEDSNKFLRIRG